jgi:hypothetical protein
MVHEAMMYQWPLSLPIFTNREDLLITGSIADDTTGNFISLNGITLALPSGFTSNAWTVTDGLIVTSSSTSITIPGFPTGNQLSSLSLTVGVGLGILVGDPIIIADTLTGLNTMTGYVISYTPSNGALNVQIGFTFEFEIRRRRDQQWTDSGYTTWFDIGVEPDFGPLLSASLGNGITITDVGFYQILIPESQVKTLTSGGTYMAALTITDSVNTRQIFLAELPMLKGGVTN